MKVWGQIILLESCKEPGHQHVPCIYDCDGITLFAGGSDVDKASLKKSLLENVNKLDLLVKNTDVLAST